MKRKNQHEIELLKFAKEHEWIITPLGWSKHTLVFNKHGHCPCDSERPNCPCPEAITEVHETGHCKCSLYWRNYDTYLSQCYLDDWPGNKTEE